MNIVLMCHNSICNHKEEYKDDLKYCPICGDELVRLIVEDKDEECVCD